MSKVDLSPLNSEINGLSELVTLLEQKYQCNWDDVIHDSFIDFNKGVNSDLASFQKIFEYLTRINNTSFNNDELLSETESILHEVESL